jgi:hypothetical protein
MFCFKCGAAMPDQAPSCPQCGAGVSEAPQIAQRAPLPPPPAPAYSTHETAPQPYAIQQQADGKATTSLILGILSITCFSVLAGIPAVILGHLAKSNIRKSGGRVGGDGLATAGLLMGYISIAVVPFILAIAVPSLLRSRATADEHSAESAMRTINTAQVGYSVSYPEAGFARNLATLGPGASGSCPGEASQEHACLLNDTLGCSRPWCVKNGYRFRLSANCAQNGKCDDYLVVAVPEAIGRTGIKSFCSTSDAVIRTKTGVSLTFAPTIEECQSWPPL